MTKVSEVLKPVDEIIRDWESGAMDAAGTIEDLLAHIDTRPTPTSEQTELVERLRLVHDWLEERGQRYHTATVAQAVEALSSLPTSNGGAAQQEELAPMRPRFLRREGRYRGS